MDARQAKTQSAVFNAFSTALQTKDYNDITIADILQQAHVSRSTFYSHFSDKEDVVNKLCEKIFEHVLSQILLPEQSHDFSQSYNLKDQICHILHHLKDEFVIFKALVKGSSRTVFVQNFTGFFMTFYDEKIAQYMDRVDISIDKKYLRNHIVTSFLQTVIWWIENNMQPTPEELADDYFELVCARFYS